MPGEKIWYVRPHFMMLLFITADYFSSIYNFLLNLLLLGISDSLLNQFIISDHHMFLIGAAIIVLLP